MLGASYPQARPPALTPPIIEAMTQRALPPESGADPSGSAAEAGGGRFLTLADTAEALNVSVGQAYALVRSGELPAIKVGGHGHWRVERSMLEHYIEAKYEESRRMSLWQQSDFASLREYSFGGRQPTDNGDR